MLKQAEIKSIVLQSEAVENAIFRDEAIKTRKAQKNELNGKLKVVMEEIEADFQNTSEYAKMEIISKLQQIRLMNK